MATENIRGRFRRWRHVRPFWGGLFLVLSGLEMFLSANMELDNIQIHIGPQGFYSYLLPVMMIAAGLLTWFSPAQRLFYGVIGIITALYSFIGLNLGGWIAGMMLGILGGALVIAWGPPEPPPPSPPPSPSREEAEEAEDRPTQEIDPVTAPITEPVRKLHRRALLIVAPLLLAATVTVAGNPPAEAALECPEGLPSRTASVSPSPSRTSAKPRPTATATGTATPPVGTPRSTGTSAAPTAGATPSPTGSGTGNPFVDGVNDFWQGVGEFFTGEKKEEVTEPGSASPSAAASPTPTAPGPKPGTTPGATPGTRPSTTPSTTPSAKAEEIACLGARQMGKVAEDGGIPLAGAKPGVVKAASVTMYNSSYDGVAEVPTGNGPIRSLKFTMDKVVNTPFSLTIDEPGSAVTVIESGELILDGDVEFYSPSFKGKLFGLIPVTFTPEQPPPLTLPILWFTDVTLDLAYVKSNVLTAEPIDIVEKNG
ncbi:DUF6114 domain-containing protein [Actinoplanes utahensis]|uniref:Uncharacterized protein n=1 Tax=Actinoplanes utahensis TaxID=1869 RepID=A0A0A6UH17_ACTUT|nr:DUF6114 domain-containing protein [Actinoplanes utahensis]KHD75305.1 hypothetical protein MB27_23920 [Actinoplanes utahensis]GIF30434.1 hypothetical protein Aut01nite_34200 [Actinoplanes utahensis]